MAIGSTLSVGLIGLKAFVIQIQAFISPGAREIRLSGVWILMAANPRDREHESGGIAQARPGA